MLRDSENYISIDCGTILYKNYKLKTQKLLYTEDAGWDLDIGNTELFIDAGLVLVFASSKLIQNKQLFTDLQSVYPNAQIALVSTGGEIYGGGVYDESFVVTAFEFTTSKFFITEEEVLKREESFAAGERVMRKLADQGDVKYTMVFAGGTEVSGTKFVEGLRNVSEGKIPFSGGLAGDGMNFQTTFLGVDRVPDGGNNALVIGFYGEDIEIIGASMGGWDTFGMKQMVTKSEGNVVFELDNEPILDIYERYLGELGAKLPESGIIYPMCVRNPDTQIPIIRTVVAIDRNDKSITFGGEVPEGCSAQIMKSNYRRLMDGSMSAVRAGTGYIPKPDAAILISCIGRKLALKHRTPHEIELIHEMLQPCSTITGFYSYGEIGPYEDNQAECYFHNQTMTVLLFTEKNV
ncbi:FIST C-terminal domain-containing protein [Candidatus Gracilibacteria bacterium]|nr:FIST C-terminal domain-containing protein [Candidatus Gracilibacteria bacterium]